MKSLRPDLAGTTFTLQTLDGGTNTQTQADAGVEAVSRHITGWDTSIDIMLGSRHPIHHRYRLRSADHVHLGRREDSRRRPWGIPGYYKLPSRRECAPTGSDHELRPEREHCFPRDGKVREFIELDLNLLTPSIAPCAMLTHSWVPVEPPSCSRPETVASAAPRARAAQPSCPPSPLAAPCKLLPV